MNFNEQFLIDCDPTEKGCHGGLMTHAFEFLKTHKIPGAEYGDYLMGE